ncbi:TolC family protein [Roseiconus nitratireducens]|uniref:TolC family protein n=1 Tax=Roseiconus nitratireducens TaxID=2605748 RepID=A0A5M6D8D4_9BACT|nr:TolC family protein [Roseiconus nitratireducens]KAA5543804.1 TolC family protein [Roseiconus nitratireducens]
MPSIPLLRPHPLAFLVWTLTVGVILAGCSRTWNRRTADREAACLVREKGGTFGSTGVYADPYSRLADPSSIDHPPMPPDDPTSHTLMHRVDGKKGFKGWDRFGRLAEVESPYWKDSLVLDDEGVAVVDLREAVRLSRLHSRDFQTNIETLYLSALDVSFERFRFDYQLFAGVDTFATSRGRRVGAQSPYTLDSFVGTRKLTATGGEIVVGFANSLLWDFWGDDTDVFSSAIDFSLLQPLLRFGGRARVLESLTQSERNLLANVRQLEQYQQGFFVEIITGRNSGPGPSLGNNVGSPGLGVIAGTPGGRSGAPSAGGYLGLLEAQQEIRNRASNIAALRDSLAQLEAAFDANRISSRLQVDQARQALLNAQSSLLIAQAAYQTRLDAFKVQMGLPPDLPLEIQDPLLERFILIDPALTDLQNTVEQSLTALRMMRDQPDADRLKSIRNDLVSLAEPIAEQVDDAREDMRRLDAILPQRREQLLRVENTILELNADVDPRVYDVDAMQQRVASLQRRVPEIENKLALLFAATAADQNGPEPAPAGDDTQSVEQTWNLYLANATELSDLLLELSLVHAEIRLQGITLRPTDIPPPEAVQYARMNRLDWMNARANLVDSWRKIEFFANGLKSDLNIVVDGQLSTRPDNVFEFDGDRSRIRFGAQFDTPTARLAERNRYRAALISYQRARRDYMLFEDRIKQSLRNTLRTITLSEINLEVRRAAVQVAIAQVDIARLKLNPPVRPDQPSRTSPTAARDLVSALSDLLDAQNDFLNVWVANEVLRILLDFEMGTMRLDPSGVWIDSGFSDDLEMPVEPVEDGLPEMLSAPGIEAELIPAGPSEGQALPEPKSVPLLGPELTPARP